MLNVYTLISYHYALRNPSAFTLIEYSKQLLVCRMYSLLLPLTLLICHLSMAHISVLLISEPRFVPMLLLLVPCGWLLFSSAFLFQTYRGAGVDTQRMSDNRRYYAQVRRYTNEYATAQECGEVTSGLHTRLALTSSGIFGQYWLEHCREMRFCVSPDKLMGSGRKLFLSSRIVTSAPHCGSLPHCQLFQGFEACLDRGAK